MISVNHIDHFVLDTTSLDRCLGFYEQAFSMQATGWESSSALKFGMQKLNIHPRGMVFSPVACATLPGGKAIVLQISPDNLPVRENMERYGTPGAPRFREFPDAVAMHDPDHDLVIASLSGHPVPESIFLQGILLPTHGIDAMLGFYARFLGAYAARGKDAAIMRFENGYVGLLPLEKGSIAERERLVPGSADFCLIANGSITDIYAELKALDAPFASSVGIVTRHGAMGPINSVYLRDPDGNLVEISTPKSP